MNTEQYIDLVKKIKELDTDYKLCKMMGWPTSRTTKYRDGQTLDNEAARQIAEILEIPLMKVIADMEVQRFSRMGKKEQAKTWAKFSKHAGRATANLLSLLAIFSSGLIFYILC
jgi:hypothetical protein